MVAVYLRLTQLVLLLSLLMFPLSIACNHLLLGNGLGSPFWFGIVAATALAAAATLLIGSLIRRAAPIIEELSAAETGFLDRLPDRWVALAIGASAAASLGLELALIRWQGTVWETFAFYKNFGLLSCFAGLGLGYALARNERIPAVMILPMFALQMLFLVDLRQYAVAARIGSLMATPIKEQFNMGFGIATQAPQIVAVYSFLGVVMFLTALAFIPVGQICGRLLGRTAQLRAYGLNLLGSLAGVILIMLLSYLWTPPVIWFAPCFVALLFLQGFDRRSGTIGVLALLTIIAILTWPSRDVTERIYSPYQLIERGPGENGMTRIRAAGQFYQEIHDLSAGTVATHKDRQALAWYYEMPYRLRPPAGTVAIVGAGTGNDVAAALRMGARHVDAIEIDPVILDIGRAYHPENPYGSPRVASIVNDARTFLRATTNRYDLIAYGLLDSHTLLSHASSVRLDSFVYTVEGLRDARARLRDDGVVCLSFWVLSPEIGRKIFLMMEEAFGGRPPVCMRSRSNEAVIFAQSKRGDLAPAPDLLKQNNFVDCSDVYAAPGIQADVSTDDWPFFYMPRRTYPVSYVWMVLLVLAVSGVLFGSFVRERLRFSHTTYFLLGAGFMLVETKGITELGLMFGNTWQVIGIVIAGILVMAYLANLVVMKAGLRRPVPALCLLLVSLGVGLAVARMGGFPATPLGQVAAVAVITVPMFFSGIAFSALLARTGEPSAALAMNLLGAMCGGLIEYNCLYFGFQFLYWIAMALYAGALFSHRFIRRLPGAPPV